MMQHHRCSTSSHGNMACSCGVYQCNYNYTQGNNSSFSTMLFSSNGGHHNNHYRGYDEENVDGYNYYSSPSVDCTLSLGTPSTRLSGNENGNGNNSNNSYHHHQEKKRSSYMSGFGWNILQSKHTTAASATKSHRVGGGNSGGDPLLARRCANCDTTSTPLWRNGPRGPKSLCNACGIRFKKEERRATAAANGTVNGGADGSNFAQPQKIPCYSSAYGSEYRFIEEHEDHNQYGYHHRDSVDHANYPFMSWRFNVTDRPSLVHDFTR